MTGKITLYELQLMIRDSLYISFPEMYWVVAEISELKENQAGHCYLELIDKESDVKNIRARIRAIIWCKRFGLLKSYFENVTGEAFREGLKVLVRVKLEYHELYGLSLIICDIDPAFTMGELALKRQMIIRQLEEEGVYDMNRELNLPFAMQRIAIISSGSAAGYTDFINHLQNNAEGYVFYTKLFESPMQGAETEHGIINALDRISVHSDTFDVVVIIRGGGSHVDLSWFDNYNIAYHITQFPLPVLTGIGHEKDMSVSDMVAFSALKTPTAVADFIIAHNKEIETHLVEMTSTLKDLSKNIITGNSSKLENAGLRLLPLTWIHLAELKSQLSGNSIRLVRFGGEYIRKAGVIPSSLATRITTATRSLLTAKKAFFEISRENIETESFKIVQLNSLKVSAYNKNLELLKPENVLQRGYTITLFNGEIRKSKAGLQPGDKIETQFHDGIVSSRIMEEQEET